jgi:Arc/MetJ-type ribon-helix-helix transcriptional regulator
MREPAEIQILLSGDALDFVRSKVSSGAFASESDVVQECIAAFREGDTELEEWLAEIAVPAYNRFLADPSLGIPLEQVKAELAEEALKLAETR